MHEGQPTNSDDGDPRQAEAPPVADLTDEEVEAAFEELVAQIDAEQRTAEI